MPHIKSASLLAHLGQFEQPRTTLSYVEEDGTCVSVRIPIFAPNLSARELVKAGKEKGVRVRVRSGKQDTKVSIPPGKDAKAWVETAIRFGKSAS